MSVLEIVLGVLCLVFLGIAAFLGSEMLKKFRFMQGFIRDSNQLVTWTHHGTLFPGMYKIVLRGTKPFSALVGFKLGSGFDYYGFVQARHAVDSEYFAIIETYMGKKTVEFQFLVNSDLKDCQVMVTSDKTRGGGFAPHVSYPPHWWQRLGFFA